MNTEEVCTTVFKNPKDTAEEQWVPGIVLNTASAPTCGAISVTTNAPPLRGGSSHDVNYIQMFCLLEPTHLSFSLDLLVFLFTDMRSMNNKFKQCYNINVILLISA